MMSGACDDGLSRAPTESDIFNVYFYPPGAAERYLGRVTGISACQSVARTHASSAKMGRNDRWSYICCREARGSHCYDKYR